MPTLEDVVKFIADAEPQAWSLIMREIDHARKVRDQNAAFLLKDGDRVSLVIGPKAKPVTATVEKVNRPRGRVCVVFDGDSGGRLSLPASMVKPA